MSNNALWAWTLTTQDRWRDPYEWNGVRTYCSSEQGVARIFASREDAEAHFHAWFVDEFSQSWEDIDDDESAPEAYSLAIYTLEV